MKWQKEKKECNACEYILLERRCEIQCQEEEKGKNRRVKTRQKRKPIYNSYVASHPQNQPGSRQLLSSAISLYS